MERDAHARLIARLLALRWLPREDAEARRLLVDLSFREEVESRLAACGLRLLDHPFADHIAVALAQSTESAVFETGGQWAATTIALPKDAIALLVILWALIILPKRERQLARANGEEGQMDMFGGVPGQLTADASRGIPENVLLEDYARLLGGRARITQFILPQLSRLGFIERRNKVIYEGPLLDLAFDYGEMAPRILQGALADLLRKQDEPRNTEGDAS
ncbi:hypothetical protein [Thiobacter aerophilum]|uniref:DUF4194 domain-containing protein n=1 Tax=Thiobacter aerophilum TaxID=3121275 RepID=A0ABV0EFP6_9BURK